MNIVRYNINTECNTDSGNDTNEYIFNILQNPDKGSEFEAHKNSITKEKTEQDILTLLTQKGYGIILIQDGDTIIGHHAFQVHNGIVHLFSSFLAENYRSKGYPNAAYQLFIRENIDNYKGLKLGKGSGETNNVHPYPEKEYKRIKTWLEGNHILGYVFSFDDTTHLIKREKDA